MLDDYVADCDDDNDGDDGDDDDDLSKFKIGA